MRVMRGKRALITGAASGIGRAIALRLAREGAHVCLLDIDDRRSDEVLAKVLEQGVEAVLLGVGAGHVELLSPLGDDTPVGKFLDKKGPGLHHVAYRVGDIESALNELRDQGVRLIDEKPRVGICGSRVAFVHPTAAASVLTELVEPAEE